jgi:predicted transcriptional regulator
MKKQMCSYRFDKHFIKRLEQLAELKDTSKTDIITKAVMDWVDNNLDGLEKRYKKKVDRYKKLKRLGLTA